MTMMLGRNAATQGELARAEKLLLDATRTMKGLNDRSQLCEAQRSLAEVYVEMGRLEEAERYALEARESVGPDDRLSLSTTKVSLAVVRAAQRRDDEAEKLFRAAVEELERYQMRAIERWALSKLVGFYRERGREDEAVGYEERLAELSPSRIAPIA